MPSVSRDIGNPQPGYFKTRLVKNGPWVAARIWRECECTIGGGIPHISRPSCDRAGWLMAEANGVEADPFKVWINTSITKEEFEYFTATKQWAEESAPFMPEANPRKAVDLNELPVPTF
ncbi:hypothetical protein [Kiloniella antarctica]|uniref:Uncharacterized protein n=1 Tax=Kiloniella antarctica TaxID=1550907 RepID=A0ABW5BQL6_9PROT